MDILAEDLGTTEILKLFGERLKTSREKNVELERALAAKTIECNANLRRAQQSDENRAALSQELRRVTLKANERQSESSTKQEVGTCTNPQHVLDISAVHSNKTRLVEELTEQLRGKSEAEKDHLEALAEMQNALTICKQKYKDAKRQHGGAEKGHLQALDELQNALGICKQKYKDAKRQLKEAHEHMATPENNRSIDKNTAINTSTSLAQTMAFVANFASSAPTEQLWAQRERRSHTSAMPMSPSDITKHIGKERPTSHFHCFSEIAIKSGAHQWVAGPLHRPKFDVEQHNWAQAKWHPESQFERFHGETIEVFSRTVKGKTVYLGKHKAIPLKNLQFDHFEGLPDYLRRSLVDSVASQTGWTRLEGHDGGRAVISGLFKSGTIRIECLGLQFESFDQKLVASFQKLIHKKKGYTHNSWPRSLEQPQVKKRKIDEVDIASNGMAEPSSGVEEDSSVKAESDSEASEREYGNGVQWSWLTSVY
ncbi:hypothetical protein FIBSPDRAFT_903705 [Athelia psychrophila]|uniref:Uncharacterized protein n=1 Tax=Athelia psychrophila TaxID=1759441 RepID=A0A167VN30_9AGAM|nr:hypothetical protein FIBSPDRAFT_903705 [Fibularhizoctonia sp. CBS 109695]